jgi:hypothetical protein
LATTNVTVTIGGVTDTWSVTTLPAVQPPSVTTAAATDITATRATVSASVTADGGAPVLLRGVCWGPSPNPTVLNGHCLVKQGLEIGDAPFRLTGLLPNTTYFARGFASNRAGNQASEQPGDLAGLAYGEVRSFKTALPPAATAVAIEAGWNLVLVTKTVAAPTPAQNPNLLSDWWFWRFDHYEKATSLVAGTVYWIMAGGATAVHVVGTPVSGRTMPGPVNLNAGWNLVGASEAVRVPVVSPSAALAGEWWRGTGSAYERARRVSANAGCWLYATGDVRVQLPEP